MKNTPPGCVPAILIALFMAATGCAQVQTTGTQHPETALSDEQTAEKENDAMQAPAVQDEQERESGADGAEAVDNSKKPSFDESGDSDESDVQETKRTAGEDVNAYEDAYEDDSDEQECVGLRPDSEKWIDVAHNYISVQFCEPAAWFDSFFESDRADEEVRPGSRVRWRNDFIYQEGGAVDYEIDFSAKLKLPKASDSLRVTFESEGEDDENEIIPEAQQEEKRRRVGLLYEMFQSPRANFSIRVQLRPKIRLRYRYSLPVTETFLTRFTQDLERTKSVNSATTRIDFEKSLTKDLVFRWSNRQKVSEAFQGKEWGVGLILFHHLSDRSAVSYESSVAGLTKPVYRETNYRLAMRYRRNFYRKWLFYELIPEVTWPLDLETEERDEVAVFMFRLEINFENLR